MLSLSLSLSLTILMLNYTFRFFSYLAFVLGKFPSISCYSFILLEQDFLAPFKYIYIYIYTHTYTHLI